MEQDKKRRRIGLMGGTFDPIHIGHLMLAECAYEQFQPGAGAVPACPEIPRTSDTRKVGATDQLSAWIWFGWRLRTNPHFALDPEEMLPAAAIPTRTIRLRPAHGSSIRTSDYYFIIGADSLMAFDTWYRPEGICRDTAFWQSPSGISWQPGEDSRRKMHELREERYRARNSPAPDAGCRHRIAAACVQMRRRKDGPSGTM